MATIYQEPKKIADILGAHTVDLPTRLIKVQTGQRSTAFPGPEGEFDHKLEIGTILVSAADEIYFLVSATNFPTLNVSICILGELIETGPAVPADQVSATVFEAGSFQAKQLLTNPDDPIDVYTMRQRLRNNGIYLEG
jgi:hypothetical protein